MGGLEHRNIFRHYDGIQSTIDYILSVVTQPLIAKNFIELDSSLFEKSKNITKTILNNFGHVGEYEYYSDMANVFDYTFIFYPQRVQSLLEINTVLDFGAGHARQANLFSEVAPQYWATDAIENAYMAQYNYLNELAKIKNKTLFEDLEETITLNTVNEKEGLFHIPSWNLNRLGEEYFDLIICSQILPELPEETFETVFPQLMSLVKPNGIIYIRDHGLRWQPGHLYDVDKILIDNGFVAEYSVFARDKDDIHGIPRIYRKLTKDNIHRLPEKKVKAWKNSND